MTSEALGSATLTNILLIVLIVLASGLGLFGALRRARAHDLGSRVRLIESVLAGSEAPDGPMRTWLVAETALLVHLASQFGVQVLDAQDPAWEFVRTHRIGDLALRDPGFLDRARDRWLKLPEPVRAFIMELFKKLNGALEHMLPLGERSKP